jgi:hypothetical protein
MVLSGSLAPAETRGSADQTEIRGGEPLDLGIDNPAGARRFVGQKATNTFVQ